ncbi:Down syndrome cell adhesion molecule-like protein Dscam2 [Lucilia cuprina]|uniref:Down syndrome cell adhesion molecule-like protein Dscam2 n=1 Tax=Lucilia cuprina TaxID=7375 RepID=A0A0L0C169_LUCCU|nr:Down syndrome cell adhesion molecule-like protein Dscam2 [Lucilia cuprina]
MAVKSTRLVEQTVMFEDNERIDFLQLCFPPIIEPFAFQDGLAEGMRTRTVCGVSSGDAPLKLWWLKDGETLPDLLGANVTMLDQYSSLLSIPSLSASHSGQRYSIHND